MNGIWILNLWPQIFLLISTQLSFTQHSGYFKKFWESTSIKLRKKKSAIFHPLYLIIIRLYYKQFIQYVFSNAEGQPDSIVQDIENMVRSYIEKVMHISFL
jgi:hypothetical protein